ncbi:MAG: MaoC family dehydratase [Nevskiales bacterium]|nr:MaoC family dehydratase [Nevskia sp.]
MAVRKKYLFDSLSDFIGKELGVTDWTVISQEQINLFADCTGDRQWMHVDAERCRRESPYGAPVAHGFLVLSVLAKLVADLGGIPEDATGAINTAVNNVRFRAPVLAGARVRARAGIAGVAPLNETQSLVTAAVELEVEGGAAPALTADLMVLMFR